MQSLPTCPPPSRLRPRCGGLAGVGLLACCLAAAPAVRGQSSLHGGIEIGAKGIKATVIEVMPGKEGPNTKQLFSKTANTTLAALKDGKFSADAIDETGEEVGKFFQRMQKDFKVAAANIYVVASSGLPKPPNLDALAKVIKDKTGKDLRAVNAREEVTLSILGVIKPELRDRSVLVDVGSGNTKGGYLEKADPGGKGRTVAFSLPLGTVTFTTLVKKEGAATFVATAAKLRETALAKPLADAVAKDTGLAKRDRVYLSGGSAWAMVTLLKPETAAESYVPVSADDIANYHKLVTATPTEFPKVDFTTIKDEKARARAEREVQRVRDVFTPENLVAGSEILRALSSGLHFKDKEVFFPRYGYIAWIQAYVEEKAAPPQPPRPPDAVKPPPKKPESIPRPGGREVIPDRTVPGQVSPPVYSSGMPSCSGGPVIYYPAPCYTIYPSYSGPNCYTPCHRGFRIFRR